MNNSLGNLSRNSYGHLTRREMLVGASLAAASGLLPSDGISAMQKSVDSGTTKLDGIEVYYEVHGGPLNTGRVPIVLLHGGAMTLETAYAPELIARFVRHQPVILIEPQGHGRTADRPGQPMTVVQMAKDTAGVLAHLGVRQADLYGHSLGGMIATGVAIRHPQVVRNVTTLGTPYQLEGFRADLVRLQRDPNATPSPELAKLLPTGSDFASWRASFKRIAPDPAAYDAILARLNTALATWTGWTEAELRSIRAPTLIAVGDNDFVRVEHAAEVARLIPNARLAVLPGTTHLNIVTREAWLRPMMQAIEQG